MSDESKRKDKFLKAWASGAVVLGAILLSLLILRNCREADTTLDNGANAPPIKTP